VSRAPAEQGGRKGLGDDLLSPRVAIFPWTRFLLRRIQQRPPRVSATAELHFGTTRGLEFFNSFYYFTLLFCGAQ
jgi:hypothetical protein